MRHPLAPHRSAAKFLLILIAILAHGSLFAQLPDLTISNVNAPPSAAVGLSVTIRWTTSNAGNASSGPGFLLDGVYLSTDQILDKDVDISMNYYFHLTEIAASSSEEDSIDVLIPEVSAGQYYVLVSADDLLMITESNEGNNVASSAAMTVTTEAPDFQFVSVDVPATGSSGELLPLTYTVSNVGTADVVSQNWYDGITLSADTLYGNEDDMTIGYSILDTSVNMGDAYSRSPGAGLPSNLSGIFYIFIEADYIGQIYEASEANNLGRSGPIAIDLKRPDLAVSLIQLPDSVNAGEKLHFTYQVTNLGDTSTNAQAWSDLIALSSDTVALDDTFLTIIGHTANLPAGQTAIITDSVSMPFGLQQGKFHVIVTADMYAQINESNESNNGGVSNLVTFGFSGPDLTVTQVQVPSNAFSGQQIEVSWFVANGGTLGTNAPQWFDHLYLSPDPVFDPLTATHVAYYENVSYLAAGESYANTQTVTLPNGIVGGYYIYVRTDALSQVPEMDDSNNTSRNDPAMSVNLSDSPDLVVSTFSAPGNAFSGDLITISYAVTNSGAASTGTPVWLDYLYLSQDSTFNPLTATFLRVMLHNSVLAPESSYAGTIPINLPNAISGRYYLYLSTDVGNYVYEYTGEGNNVRRDSIDIVLTPPPDLVVTSVTAPAAGSSGAKIGVSWTVQNQGSTAPFEPQWHDRLYLSALPAFDPDSSLVVGTYTLGGSFAPDSSVTRSDSVVVPNGLSGTYYLYARADHANEVFENLFENNNVTRSAAGISISLSPWPDLDVVSLSHPSAAAAGDQVELSWTVQNSGAGPVNAPLWRDRVYISANGVWDSSDATLLKDVPRGTALSSSESYSQTVTVTIPVTSTGTQYFYVVVDAGRNVYEHTDEGNNIERGNVVTVQPYPPVDLRASGVSLPPSGLSGVTVALQWTITNIGAAKTIESKWDDAVYLSTDTVLSPGSDSLLLVVKRQGVLEPSGAYSRDLMVRLPDGITGSYFALVQADSGSAVNDADTTNNVAHSASIIVTLSPPSDLHVLSIDAPPAGQSGQPVTVRFMVQNSGAGPTLVSGWNDAIFISTDVYLDPADVRLVTRPHTSALGVGASYNDTVEVTIPGYSNGELFLLAQTDSKNQVFEQSAEGNNVTSRPITVNIASPSDLIVTSISVPDTSVSGAEVTISWTLENQGANPAIGSMYDAVYLSANSTWEVTDPLFGMRRHEINIAPGASMTLSVKGSVGELFAADSTGTISGPLPGFPPGDYYTLVRTDIRNNIRESDEGNNTGASSETTTIDVPALQLGVPTITSVTEGGQRFFRVATGAGQTLRISLDGDSPTASIEMYARFGTVPSRSQFDFAYGTAFSPDQEITIPESEAGTYYIMLFGDQAAGDSVTATILAESVLFSITSVSPIVGGNTGEVTMTVVGARFVPGTTVRLSGPGGATPPVIRSSVLDASRIEATFQLSGGLPLGAYDVIVRRPDNSEVALPGGFTLEQGRSLSANLGFGPPNVIARGGSGFYAISVENTTNVDIPYLMVYVIIPAGQQFTVASNDLKTLSQILPDSIRAIAPLQDYFDEGLWRYIPLTARNVRVGQILSVSFTAFDVQGTEFPIQIAVDAIDRTDFLNGQLLYIELFRQALLIDTSGKFNAEFYNLAHSPDAFLDLMLQTYVDMGILLPSEVATVTTQRFAQIMEKVAEMPLHVQKMRDALRPSLTTCEDDFNWLELSIRIVIIAGGLIAGTLLAPVTLGLSAALAVGSAIGLAMNIGAIFNGTPGLAARIFCDDPRTPTRVVASKDPNDITGPAGWGENRWVALTETMPYTVRFENDPKLATAPAQVVNIEMILDSTVDARSFRLGEFGFGGFRFSGGGGRPNFSQRLDVRDSLGIYVDVSAGVDIVNERAFWSFQSVNPTTGDIPSNPLSGFLPVNDSLHRGEGFVKFSYRPKPTSATGDQITAKAKIVFDVNDPIDTPPTFNTVDAGLPHSAVAVLPPTSDSTSFILRWNGADDSTGSGIRHYTVYVSRNDSAYVPFVMNMADTLALFSGVYGSSYDFYSLATDNAGNSEPAKASPDASTLLTGVLDEQGGLPLVYGLSQNYPNPFNPKTVIRYDLPAASRVTLKVFNVLGQLVATIAEGVEPAGTKVKEWDAANLSSGIYYYRLTAVGADRSAGTFTFVKKMLLVK